MKFKKNIQITVIAILLILFSACSKQSSNPPKSLSKQSLELPKSVTQLYQIHAEVEKASDYLQYRKINIPERIQGFIASCMQIYDRSRVFLLLIDDSTKDYSYKEAGLYNFETGEYKTLFPAEEGQSFYLRTCNEKYLIFNASKDNFDTSTLYAYSFETEEVFEIYPYTVDPRTNRNVYLNLNSVLLVGNTLWFDDYFLGKEEEILIDLYTYDLDTRTLEKKDRNAQNPMLHKGKVHYFVKNERGAFDDIKAYGEEERIHVKDNLEAINAIDKEIYCETAETNEAEHSTIYRIKEILSGKVLLSTDTKPMDQVKATEHFVTWRNFDDATPLIYDVKAKKLLLFDDFDARNNCYLTKDNYGILFHFFPGKGIDYYFFERKE